MTAQIYSIFLQDYAGPITDVTIANNWFSANRAAWARAPPLGQELSC